MTSLPVEYGGCLWTPDPGCLSDEWDALPVIEQERALALATSSLQALTAHRVSECPITVRPCAPRCCIPGYSLWTGAGAGWFPVNYGGGLWTNGCGCKDACDCSSACEITLPAPVGRLDEIKVDGVPISLTDVRLDNGNILVWEGADPCPFNVAQDLSKPDTEAGTFSITYLNAYPPGALGAAAVAYLALEFARACKPKGKCSLPRGVTSVVRNGVSWEIDTGLFPGGVTGIDMADAFIRAWNPDHRTQQTRIYSPDTRPPRRTRRL